MSQQDHWIPIMGTPIAIKDNHLKGCDITCLSFISVILILILLLPSVLVLSTIIELLSKKN